MNTILGTMCQSHPKLHSVMQVLATTLHDSLIGMFAIVILIIAVALLIAAMAFVANDKPWHSTAEKLGFAVVAILGVILCSLLLLMLITMAVMAFIMTLLLSY